MAFSLQLFILAVFSMPVFAKDDPEASMMAPEIIEYWGYPVEVIPVTTSDGYVLHIHRIPHGRNDSRSEQKRPVLFLQHGLESSSSCWITNFPHQSFGFIAADAGFDVWMGNSRGNLYSIGHTSLSTTCSEYWKFSWDDMASKDLEAMIDEALRRSNNSQLYYVGHSQGTLIMLAKLATDPAFNQKIRKFFALAPVATVKFVNGLIAFVAENFYPEIDLLYKWFGMNEFAPEDSFLHTVSEALCHTPVDEKLCESIMFLIAGTDSNQMNTTRIPVYLADEPCGTSTMNMLHWMQMVKSGLTQAFDWGSDEDNIKHYGTPIPPIYNLSTITTDVHLYWSANDRLATKRDIELNLLPKLEKALKESVQLKDFNHIDFVYGMRASTEVISPIIETIRNDIKFL